MFVQENLLHFRVQFPLASLSLQPAHSGVSLEEYYGSEISAPLENLERPSLSFSSFAGNKLKS